MIEKVFTKNKKCLVCGELFLLKSVRQNVCSKDCGLSKYKRECVQCGNCFFVKYKYQTNKFCGLKCSANYNNNFRKKTYPTADCVKCGENFEIKRKESSGKFCSRKCSDATNKNQPAETAAETCPFCNKTFVHLKRVRQKFCSKDCDKAHRKTITGAARYNFKEKIQMNCELCGKSCSVTPALVSRFRFCSLRCSGTYSAKNQPRISSIELMMKEQFDKANLKYEQQFIIDYFITDFAFPEQKLIVECDGIYWHNLPKQKTKDKRKDCYLKHKGWKVLRLLETEIKTNAANCLQEVLDNLQIL
jgi:very-short-patch-repair endonuclease